MSRFVRVLFLLVVALASTSTGAATAKAGLGWSLEECISHFGSIDYSETDPSTDLPKHHFKVKDFEITVILNKDAKVVCITYFSHFMSDDDAKTLLAGNAPKAEWKVRLKQHASQPGDEIFWDGFEDGGRKYAADSWTILYQNANSQVYGTKVLEIETVEYTDLEKEFQEQRKKRLLNM